MYKFVKKDEKLIRIKWEIKDSKHFLRIEIKEDSTFN